MKRILLRCLVGLGGCVCLMGLLLLLIACLQQPLLGGMLVLCGSSTIGLAACAVVCGAIFQAERSDLLEKMRSRPRLCWLAGLLVLSVEAFCLAALPGRGLWAALSVLFNLWCLARALPALAEWVACETGTGPRWQLGMGGLLLGLAGSVPVFGWLMLPQLAILSLGAAVCRRS